MTNARRSKMEFTMAIVRTVAALLGAIVSAIVLWKVRHN